MSGSVTPRIGAVLLGASAGGVEALGSLLPALRRSAQVPIFVVVHLPREHPSRLAEIFASRCQVAVTEAEDKQPVLPSTVYFAPPDYHLLVDQGPSIALSTDEAVHFSRPSIDVLFESAVDVYAGALLGIVLTGANEDGAAGLRAVARAGGLTLIQEPASASASAMPLAALRAVPQSRVLGLPQIAELLRELEAGELTSWPSRSSG